MGGTGYKRPAKGTLKTDIAIKMLFLRFLIIEYVRQEVYGRGHTVGQ